MERIAFIFGEYFVSWSAIVLALAAVSAVVLFWGLYLGKSGNALAAFLVTPLAILFSTVLARMLHWYCRPDRYADFHAAMTVLSGGGYALAGVFAGCFLAAVLVRLLKISKNLPEMLDAMSLAGLCGIGVGRLGSFFNSSDRGQVVSAVWGLPWVYPVVNPVSGEMEYRLATFALQAIVAGVLLVILLVVYLVRNRRGRGRDGDICLMFLLCYGASQVVLDSTRYDSLFFRSNGFVGIVQVLAAVGLALPVVLFSVRLVKARGYRKWYPAIWLLQVALLGGAGYMEYFVQRHASQAALGYGIMSVCLLALVMVSCWMYVSVQRAQRLAPGADFGG